MTETAEEYLLGIGKRLGGENPRVDFHLHTNWTDGTHGVREMYEEACGLRIEGILFSEHVRISSGDWFQKFVEDVRALPTKPCRAFVGAEVRVTDFDGNVNLAEEVASTCDLIIGSVHRFPDKRGRPLPFEKVSREDVLETEFKLAHALLENPSIHILGHPFGISITRFGLFPPDDMLFHLVEKAAREKVAFEVNSHYHPDPWRLIELCKETGAMVSLGSDAHSKEEVGEIVRVLNNGKKIR